MKKLIVLGLTLVLVSPAMAGFTVTQPGPMYSDGLTETPVPDAVVNNGIFSFTYAGPDFLVGDIVFTGTLVSDYPSEARINITDPFGSTAGWNPGGSVTGQIISGGGAFWTGTAGTWYFTFSESYDDAGIDATWTDMTFEFLDAPPPPQYIWVRDFEGGLPANWSVVDNLGASTCNWDVYDPSLGDRTNYVGSGMYAACDSDLAGSPGGPYDSSLFSESFAIPAGAELHFDYYFNAYASSNDSASVVLHTGSSGDIVLLQSDAIDIAAGHQSFDLSAYVGDTATVEFRYYGSGWNWYAQVDNFGLTPEPGTLALLGLGLLGLIRRR